MLETLRLQIRAFCEGDRSAAVDLLSNADFMVFSNSGALDDTAAHHRFDEILAHSRDLKGKMAVFLKWSQTLIGYCGVEPFRLHGNMEWELGYRLLPEHRGKGYATEAASAVVARIPHKLYAYVDHQNAPLVAVLNRLGFLMVGSCAIDGKQYALFCRNKTEYAHEG